MPEASSDDAEDSRLFGEAVTLAIRLQGADDPKAALAALEIWQRRSPRHRQIWAEVIEIQGMTGEILGGGNRRDRLSRRSLLGLGVAGLGLGMIFGPGLVLQARADHVTGTGQIRAMDLPDATRLTLGPDSAMVADFDGGRRHVRLLQGMVYCETAAAPGGPALEIGVGDLTLRTADAALALSSEGGAISLALDRGHAWPGDGAPPLGPGDTMRVDLAGQVARGTQSVGEAGAWRTGLITARDETVGVLVERIARWLPGRVVMASPALARRRVAGVFDMTEPLGALAAVVRPHGGHVRQITPLLTVISTV